MEQEEAETRHCGFLLEISSSAFYILSPPQSMISLLDHIKPFALF
jgi:hypothetical protein